MAAQMDQTAKDSPSAISFSCFGTSVSLGRTHCRPVRPKFYNKKVGYPEGSNFGTAAVATNRVDDDDNGGISGDAQMVCPSGSDLDWWCKLDSYRYACESEGVHSVGSCGARMNEYQKFSG